MAVRRLAGTGGSIATALAVAIAIAPVAALPAGAEGAILGVDNPSAITNSYIVVFDRAATSATSAASAASGVDGVAGRLAGKYGVRVDHVYRHALRGFAGTMSELAARRLAADSGVAFVEQNVAVSLAATQSPVPSWGLDRIDQRNLPLNSSFSYPSTASNVTAYIIDSGIRTTHTTFGGRAVWGTNTVDANNSDCNGHGTHVAGTVGGSEYGVAKGVRLVAVKVFDCSGVGTAAGVAAGVDWVTGNHAAGAPAVANMSLGGSGTNAAIETAVRNGIADGVTYAVASGNSGSDACNFTPARVTQAITVNASDSSDNRAGFSNFGTCTDIFAPGVSITSASNASNSATAIMSGTSMATPHVAGGAALILGASPGATPAEVASALLTNATPSKIVSPGAGSPNLLLFVNTGGCAGCPVVNHPGNRAGRAGIADSVQLTASGGSTPYTWSATGLPAGMSINSANGLISGTPTTAAAHTVTVTATDTASRAGSTSFGWTINPNLDGTWSCTIPIGYTWTRVANEYNVCTPNGWAYRYQLRWPVDNAFNACAVPAGFT